MSEIEFDQQLDRILKMLIQNFLPNKEVFNSKEAGLYMGLLVYYVYTLAGRGRFTSNRPNNGNHFYKTRYWHYRLLTVGRVASSPISEAEKLTILNPERG